MFKIVGHIKIFEHVEFLEKISLWDFHDLENIECAVKLFAIPTTI
jgi:hypothetical protein